MFRSQKEEKWRLSSQMEICYTEYSDCRFKLFLKHFAENLIFNTGNINSIVIPQSSQFIFPGSFGQIQQDRQPNDLLSLSLSADIPPPAEAKFFLFFLPGENTKNIPFRKNPVKHDRFPLRVWKQRGGLVQFKNK